MQTRSHVAALLCLIAGALALSPAFGQERFSLFVPTPPWDVERMVNFADLQSGDLVIDLGSGDGRIVIDAVRRFPGVRGRGVEINDKLVRDSRSKAQADGIADRVQFLHQNAFDAEIGDATVIFLWVYPELMQLLRPKILREARPGARIVTRSWDLGTWPADSVLKTGSSHVYKWIVPARVDGNWNWEIDVGNAARQYSAVIEQRFQAVEGVVRMDKRRNLLENMRLTGDQISFSLAITVDGAGLVHHQFQGRVAKDAIEGTVRIRPDAQEQGVELPWRAERASSSHYFSPTGVDID